MSDRGDVAVVLVTSPDPETAERLSRALLNERLVACANILPAIRSIYWWRDELEESDEVLLLLKARTEDVPEIAARVRELHPNELPEVIATRVVGGLDAYLEWVQRETRRSDE